LGSLKSRFSDREATIRRRFAVAKVGSDVTRDTISHPKHNFFIFYVAFLDNYAR
jgi:hypothetical protein